MKDHQTTLPNFRMLLDLLAKKARSDRQAALVLGVTQGSYSKWRRGIAYPEDEQAITIANYLQMPPAVVLLIVRADRTGSREARNIWLRIAEQVGRAATVAAVAIGASATPSPAPAQGNSSAPGQGLCIMLSRRRRNSSSTRDQLARFGALAARTLGLALPSIAS